MQAVKTWLAGLGEDYFWVGATDLGGADVIQWIHSGENIDAKFWMIGEPHHSHGDCVSLDKHGGLRMDDCQVVRPPLCQL